MAEVAPKVAVEKEGMTTIVSIDRFAQARNAVDPETAILLREAFLAFDADDSQSVAILTGREVGAREAFDWGLANRLVPEGQALAEAKALAEQLAKFPQTCLRSDRRSSYDQWALDVPAALVNEARHGMPALQAESRKGAARFAAGKGRGGDFGEI